MEEIERIDVSDLEEARQHHPDHVQRYDFAAALDLQAPLLDIACGQGYGSAILRSAAGFVASVDIDLGALRRAQEHFDGHGLLADGRALPFRDGSFATVVSFETIEHIDGADVFVRELARLLRPGGRLVLSTPWRERTVSNPTPYHVWEYSREDLLDMLSPHFEAVRHFGQSNDAYRAAASVLRSPLRRVRPLVHRLVPAWLRRRLWATVVPRTHTGHTQGLTISETAAHAPIQIVVAERRDG